MAQSEERGASTEQLYAKNRALLNFYANSLKNVNEAYLSTCDKLTRWLADERAFYKEVQPLVSGYILLDETQGIRLRSNR
jgi:hypothetical protein